MVALHSNSQSGRNWIAFDRTMHRFLTFSPTWANRICTSISFPLPSRRFLTAASPSWGISWSPRLTPLIQRPWKTTDWSFSSRRPKITFSKISGTFEEKEEMKRKGKCLSVGSTRSCVFRDLSRCRCKDLDANIGDLAGILNDMESALGAWMCRTKCSSAVAVMFCILFSSCVLIRQRASCQPKCCNRPLC